jgi:hypothetical protein
MVQVARRRAGATIAHSAKVVHCLLRAIGISSPTLVTVGPISKIAQWQNLPPGASDHRQSKRTFSCRQARHSRRVVAARPRLRMYRFLVYGHWVERLQSLTGKPCILRGRANIWFLSVGKDSFWQPDAASSKRCIFKGTMSRPRSGHRTTCRVPRAVLPGEAARERFGADEPFRASSMPCKCAAAFSIS